MTAEGWIIDGVVVASTTDAEPPTVVLRPVTGPAGYVFNEDGEVVVSVGVVGVEE